MLAPPPPPPPPPPAPPSPSSSTPRAPPSPLVVAAAHPSRCRPSPPPAPDRGVDVAAGGALGRPTFTPLRTEPPPRLFATWWLRYVLALAQLVAIVVVLLREYDTAGGMDVLFVVIPHVMAAVMLVGWSALAMIDAARLVPATRYRRRSRAWLAVVLWLVAFAAPVAAIVVVRAA